MNDIDKTPDGSHRPRIMIVEDEVLIGADLAADLQYLGYEVCANVTTAEKALYLIDKIHPDLVFLDIVLQGGMDGITAAEIIREKVGIPVIFLTAYADTNRLERAKLTYPFGYLMKPFHERDLKIAVEMALYVGNIDAERKKATAALENSEKKYRFLADNAEDVIFTLDMNFKYTYVSPSVFKLRGFTASEVMKQTLNDVLTPDSLSLVAKVISEELNTDGFEGTNPHRIITLELESNRKNGTTVWTEVKSSFVRDESGKTIGVLGVTRDITERRNSEKALRASEERFRNLLQNVPFLAVQTYGSDGITQFWNRASHPFRHMDRMGSPNFGTEHP
ncbi:MAG: PAS domain S-box protein, partial [Deltaproteobacteria bacterium]|nr:PAS domain S-box protein [Deltaproteobacteria bacterium]